MTMARRFCVSLLAACLAIGAATHLVEIGRDGMLPYRFAPIALNAFWTSLAAIDLVAAGLLWYRPRAGLLLTLAIMIADVGVNSYAAYGLRLLPQVWPLQLQTLFLGFVLGCIGFVWSTPEAPSRRRDAPDAMHRR
jgi:hypothetical protein